MISEKDREAFLELIFPPIDHKLTYCIGTTFSLELPCLIQLALNAQGKTTWEASPGFHKEFELINDFAQKACIFSQNCKIKTIPDVKPENLKIFRMLDGIVHEIPSPSKFGVFHPKVWFLRFDGPDEDEPVFKLIVMSRNLTTSKKWDISTSVSGTVGSKSPFNDELKDFFAALGSKSSLQSKNNHILKMAMKDLEQVEFNIKGRSFKDFDFSFKWGRDKTFKQINYSSYKKVIVVSPSLCPKELARLEKLSKITLVTGLSDIHKLSEFPNLQKNTLVSGLQDLDLHAKMYFGLHDDGTDVVVGSANCTNAAWSGDNVEANAMISTSVAAFQDFKESFIGKDNQWQPWLTPYNQLEMKTKEDDQSEILQKLLEDLQRDLGLGEFVVDYGQKETRISYNKQINLPSGVTGNFKILGHSESASLTDVISSGVSFEKILLKDQTSFVEVSLQTKEGNNLSFYTVAVTNINRRERNKQLLAATLKDWNSFWDYLGIVLNIDPKKFKKVPKDKKGGGTGKSEGEAWFLKEDYLEKLMLEAAQSPESVEKIENALVALEQNTKDQKILELQRFKSIWRPFKQAFEEFKKHG